MPSAIQTPTYAAQNASILNDGSADSPRGWAISTNADYTFTATGPSRVMVSAPSAARTVTLPTTGIKAGYVAEVVVFGATKTNHVIVKSSAAEEIGGTNVGRISSNGSLIVVALQDAPTTAAHWGISSVHESGEFVPDAVTNNASVLATVGITAEVTNFLRVGKTVTVSGSCNCNAASAGNADFYITLPITTSSASRVYGVSANKPGTGAASGGTVVAQNDNANIFVAIANQSVNTVTFSFTYRIV
jgi:hypothetical protein